MKTLDELIPDAVFIQLNLGNYKSDFITGKDLKAAIDQRIKEFVHAALWDHCSTNHHVEFPEALIHEPTTE